MSSSSASTADVIETLRPSAPQVPFDRATYRRSPQAAFSGPGVASSAAAALPSRASEAAFVASAPVVSPDPYRRELLQQFEATIISVSDGEFTARLHDLTASAPDEVATFEVDEIREGDRHRVVVGAVFYWNLGRLHSAHGTQMTYSEIVFRDLPLLSRRGREILDQGGSEFDDLFDL